MKLQLFFGVMICAVLTLSGADDDKSRADAMRKLWSERTKGENLALGKEVHFSAPPAYHLTKSDSDAHDLTDGKLSANSHDMIWWGKDAVGWFGGDGADNGINLLLDLGEVQNVEKIVIRCLGGASQNTLRFPKRFDLLVSKDGKDYYRAASMQKLMPAEMARSNFSDSYFLEENGKAYVYPFELKVNAEARYIGLTLTSATGGLFSDELAVIRGDARNSGFNGIYQREKEAFHMEGVIIRPRLDSFDVPVGLDVPNFMVIRDMRLPERRGDELVLHVEAPAGLALTSPEPRSVEKFTALDGTEKVRIAVPVKERPWSNQQINPLFFRLEKPLLENARAVFYTISGTQEPIRTELPIKSIAIPAVPEFKRFHISLAWMGEKNALEWPEFFDAWGKLGFNAVSTFPRYWTAKNSYADLLTEARKRGYKVIMNESPLHVMKEAQGKDSEIYCQVKNLQGLCPSYRGELYRKEIDRVERMAENSRPDYVFMDIEAWYNSDTTAKSCARCLEAQKKSGLPMEQYAKEAVTGILKDLHDAIVRGSEKMGIARPVIGAYGMHPSAPDRSQMVMNFQMIFPKYVDIAQPSLYYGSYISRIRETIRNDYKILKERRSIPWLTAGTYGEFDPHYLEFIVLEAFMNGVSGITYYIYSDFDTPQDFFYHAKALSLLAPYETLLADGQMVELETSNPAITVSAWQKDGEMLILAGNYALADEKINLKLPYSKVSQVKDLRDGGRIQAAAELPLEVPKGNIRLLYVKQ